MRARRKARALGRPPHRTKQAPTAPGRDGLAPARPVFHIRAKGTIRQFETSAEPSRPPRRQSNQRTMRVAASLVTLPTELLTCTAKSAPLSAALVAGVVYVALMAPLIFTPFLCHW